MNVTRIAPATVLAGLLLLACGRADAGISAGSAAPGFKLPDTHGTQHNLEQYRGRYVVLEWLNHDCPFVRKHYDTGNMQALQKELTAKGVVWLSINSSAEGKQGHFKQPKANSLTKQKGATPTAVLLDWDGAVGRSYRARTTPHMFIIDPKGSIIYNGAIDDDSSYFKSKEDVAKAKNYVRLALSQALAGNPVKVASTKPYGCSVKY